MSTSNMKDKLKGNFGALQGLKKQEDSNNHKCNNNNTNNSYDNNNQIENNTDKSNASASSIEDKLRGFALKSKKRKIKNATYGLYEDQQEDVRRIASDLNLGVNEFMRESMDLVIELFNQQLEDKK